MNVLLTIPGAIQAHRARHAANLRPGSAAYALAACAMLSGHLLAAAVMPPPSTAARQTELSIPLDMAMKPWVGDLNGMIERRIIRVLTTYSKTFYFTDNGTQRGASCDMFRLFEEDLNKQLARENKLKQKHLKVQVVFIPVARDELFPALAAGKGDIAAANLTITPERQKLVDFSTPLYRNVSEVLVSGPASPTVATTTDLSGKALFVRASSSYHESLVALNKRFAAEQRPGVTIKDAPEALEDEDLLEMVHAGLIPLTVVDKHKADFWKQVFPKIIVHDAVVLRTGGTIAWAIRKGCPRLKGVLDDFAARNGKGTLNGNTILTKYLKNAKYVQDVASEAERNKFLALVQHFQKYAGRYDVDWLLMAAQGYQESCLDQSARSKSGAIGIMQIMPATGKELAVGDITQTEPNIHAGVKYMRWMMDRYYGKEPMTSLDKALFTFASYNAGPKRVSDLRKEAARRGLNPNIWFNNVEYIAAEKIGAETVTYVGNIYKYYIAYRLIQESIEEKQKTLDKMKGQGR